VVLIDEIEMNR